MSEANAKDDGKNVCRVISKHKACKRAYKRVSITAETITTFNMRV